MVSMSAALFGRCNSWTWGNSSHPVTWSHRRTAASPVGGSTSTGPKRACPSSNTRVGTPNPPFPATVSCSARTSSPVVGSSMAARTMAGSSPSSARSSSATSGRWGLRPSTWRGPAGRLVPPVEQVHVLTSEQRTDPHHRPSVGPLSFPGVLLPLLAVDLLEAEEPPPHVDTGSVAHVADPQRGLVGVRAHDVEVEVDSGRLLDGHGAPLHRRSSPHPRPENRTLTP